MAGEKGPISIDVPRGTKVSLEKGKLKAEPSRNVWQRLGLQYTEPTIVVDLSKAGRPTKIETSKSVVKVDPGSNGGKVVEFKGKGSLKVAGDKVELKAA